MRCSIELIVVVIESADQGAHSAVGLHRSQRTSITTIPARSRVSQDIDQGVLCCVLHAKINCCTRRQYVGSASLTEALRLLKRPIEEPIRSVHEVGINNFGRIEPGGMHLTGAHIA